MNYSIYLHSELLNHFTGEQDHRLARRLNLVSSHLAAHGRTSIVKSCRDELNRGWLRTPVDGNHQYLWWTRHSDAPAEGAGFPEGAIVLRDVRHHDDHSELKIDGLAREYMLISRENHEDIEQPLTEKQNDFIHSQALVRILIGKPGSGKTTALWRAVTSAGEQQQQNHVLYLTWSRRLADKAKEHFNFFCDQNITVKTGNIRGFFGELLQRDIPFVSPEKSYSEFKSKLTYLESNIIGNWRNHIHCLYAEVRAIMFGMANPALDGSRITRLDAESYLELRRDTLRADADFVPRIINRIIDSLQPDAWIPELLAASDVIKSMCANGISDDFLRYDTIVVDEVQDLTQIELTALMNFHERLSIKRREEGREPVRLLLAGDEGQTVVPTLFRWSSLKDVVEISLSAINANRTFGSGVEEITLDSNLRCPSNVRDVLDRASACYAQLPREDRPGNQVRPVDDDIHDARLFHTVCATFEDAANLLSTLMEQPDIAVICFDEMIRRMLGECSVMEDVAERILTPAEAKGLEFQSVCLINPGSHLLKFTRAAEAACNLYGLAARTSLDQFRVAVSRATGDLVFLDIASSEEEISYSKEILDIPVEIDAAGLVAFLQDVDSTPEDRVRAQLDIAMSLREQNMHRSWNITKRAFRMLGDAKLTNGVADAALRCEVGIEILSQASLMIASPTHEDDDVTDWTRIIAEASIEADLENAPELFGNFQKWLMQEGSSLSAETCKLAVELADGIVTAEPSAEWILPAIKSVAQRLRSNFVDATNYESSALKFTGAVDLWLDITEFSGDLELMVRTLRVKAFETLIAKKQLAYAEQILSLIPSDQRLDGMLHEAYGRYSDAAECYEKAGETEAALRSWRGAANWDKALMHASGEDVERLRWLVEFEDISSRKPAAINQWMTNKENERYRNLITELGDLWSSSKNKF